MSSRAALVLGALGLAGVVATTTAWAVASPAHGTDEGQLRELKEELAQLKASIQRQPRVEHSAPAATASGRVVHEASRADADDGAPASPEDLIEARARQEAPTMDEIYKAEKRDPGWA